MASEVLLGKGAGSMLGVEPAQCKNSCADEGVQGPGSGAAAVHWEGSGRSWRAKQDPPPAPGPGGSQKPVTLQTEPRMQGGGLDVLRKAPGGCYLMFP